MQLRYELPKRVQLHKPQVIVISGLTDQFLHEPNIEIDEFGRLISQNRRIKGVLIFIVKKNEGRS